MSTLSLPAAFLSIVRRFCAEEEGATLVEYVLLVALIAAVCVGAITLLGTSANTTLTTAAGTIK
jgi:pilus assembly protein Flp/PilA